MSFGSRTLLRPRSFARLPFCTPQDRTGQRSLLSGSAPPASFVTNDGPEADATPIDCPYENEYFHSHVSVSDNQSHSAPITPDMSSVLEDRVEKWKDSSIKLSGSAIHEGAIRYTRMPDETVNSDSQGHGQGRRRSSRAPFLTRGLALRIIRNEGLPERLVNTSYRVFPRLKRHLQHRQVKPTSLYIEARMRIASLYTRQTALRQWGEAYSKLFGKKFHSKEVEMEMPYLTEDGQVLLRKIQSDCQGDFCKVWRGLDRTVKAIHWQPLALSLLQTSPKIMLEFLLVTSEGLERPTFNMIADCFSYLDYFHFSDLENWNNGTHTYQSALLTCLDPKTWPIIILSREYIQLYLKRGNHETTARAFDMMISRGSQIGAELALLFMRDFTKYNDVDRAIRALRLVKQLKQDGFTLGSIGVMRHCCKLLTLDTVEDTPNGRNFRILPKLLEMGVRPDRDMMNVVVSNAFKARDSQLGYDMLKFMKGQGYEPDGYTYISLLMDAVKRGDRENVNQLVKEISQQPKLRDNPFLLSKIFHAHYTFAVKHMDSYADPGETFYSMLEMYNQLHDITPLKELSIVPLAYTPPPGSSNSPPSLIALYIMIATYFRCQRRSSVVYRVYDRFRDLVMRGHQTISPLAQTDHTYNEFMIALRDNPEGLRPCVRIVEDMLRAPYSNAHGAKELQGRVIVYARPTFRTWTILLSAFIYNRQPLAAEKVRKMMIQHGVKYNDVTWNVIISGYANMNKIPEMAQAIKMMEAQGYPVDSYTMKSLRYLRDPERLWVTIEELDKVEESLSSLAQPESQLPADDEGKKEEALLDQQLRQLKGRMKPKA